jgi:beta-lactamase family protein
MSLAGWVVFNTTTAMITTGLAELLCLRKPARYGSSALSGVEHLNHMRWYIDHALRLLCGRRQLAPFDDHRSLVKHLAILRRKSPPSPGQPLLRSLSLPNTHAGWTLVGGTMCRVRLHFSLLACLCVLVLLDSTPSWSATAASNDLFVASVARNLDREIDKIARQNNLPSVAVGVFVPGKGRYTFVGGFANLETRTARGLHQPFRIASITKTFAATAILILIDRGLLQKTDHIAKWYPDFPNADRITIDDLLRMRSGIPGELRGYGWNPSTKHFDDKTLFNPPLAGAAGAVVSNISDLLAFSRVSPVFFSFHVLLGARNPQPRNEDVWRPCISTFERSSFLNSEGARRTSLPDQVHLVRRM